MKNAVTLTISHQRDPEPAGHAMTCSVPFGSANCTRPSANAAIAAAA